MGRLLQTPIFPPPPYNKEGMSYWTVRFTEAVAAAFGDVTNRIENLNQTEGIMGDLPDAGENRVFYYDDTNGILYFDNGDWAAIGGPSVVEHISHNTGHPNIVVNATEPADSTLDVNEGCLWYVLV